MGEGGNLLYFFFGGNPVLLQTPEGTRTIAGLGSWEGWIFSGEMYNAERLGYRFEILRGYKFKKGLLFKEYVEKLYLLRRSYEKDNPLNLICKLLMNSLYGKFGMRATKSVIEMFDTSKKFDSQQLENVLDIYGESIQDFVRIGDVVITVRLNVNNFMHSESDDLSYGLDVNIGIASAVTAGGRMWMSQFKNNINYNLYYSDTDSIVIDKSLDESMTGNALGELKLEHTVRKAVFLAPKVYALQTFDGKEIIKVKGVTKGALVDVGIQDIEALLLKDSKMVFNQNKWFKKIFEGDITVADVAYVLKITSHKREPIYAEYPDSISQKTYEIFSDTKPYRYSDIIPKREI